MDQLEIFGESTRPPKKAVENSGAGGLPGDEAFKRTTEYQRYIKSAQWRAVRDHMFRKRGAKCENCGKTDRSKLEVHHLTYAHFGQERESELQILCKACHEAADRARREQLQREFEDRCSATAHANARETYFTKRYGEHFIPSEIDYHQFDEWLERKQERDQREWGY